MGVDVTANENRRNKVISVVLAVSCVLVVGGAIAYGIADAYRADETGTAGSGVLPAVVIGGFLGLVLLVGSIWFYGKSSARK